MDIDRFVSELDFCEIDKLKAEVGRRIRLAMNVTGYPRRYFTREGSEFQNTVGLHMGKKGGYSESSMKKFLEGDFGKDKRCRRFTAFAEGATVYFNLQKDMSYLFEDIDENSLIKRLKERWKEKNSVQLLKKMEHPGQAFREKIKEAKKISLSGVSLLNIVSGYRKEIEICLKNSGELRMILVSPNGPGIRECSFRSSNKWAEKTYQQEIENTLEKASLWLNSPNPFKVHIRFIEFLPAYALTIIEPRSSDEKIHCHARLFPFRSTSLKGPVINPDPVDHKEWFDFFCDQYEKLWEASDVWKPVMKRN